MLVVVLPSLVLLDVVERFSALKAVVLLLLVEPSRLVWLVVLPLARSWGHAKLGSGLAIIQIPN